MLRAVLLLVVTAAFSGCLSEGTVTDNDNSGVFRQGSNDGVQGPTDTVTVLDTTWDLALDGSLEFDLDVPSDALRLHLHPVVEQGVFDGLAFHLGSCDGVTPRDGPTVESDGLTINSGSINNGKTWDCGAPTGDALRIESSLGTASGTVRVTAMVPAAS